VGGGIWKLIFYVTKPISLARFKILRTKDIPEIEVIPLNIPREKGPLGASGTGEYPDVPTAPAMANAINHACGIRVRSLPITPEKINRALQR
jgi:CO/xanthine dehydrogenase Mo-binding subunit